MSLHPLHTHATFPSATGGKWLNIRIKSSSCSTFWMSASSCCTTVMPPILFPYRYSQGLLVVSTIFPSCCPVHWIRWRGSPVDLRAPPAVSCLFLRATARGTSSRLLCDGRRIRNSWAAFPTCGLPWISHSSTSLASFAVRSTVPLTSPALPAAFPSSFRAKEHLPCA